MKTEFKTYTVEEICDGFEYNELEAKGLYGLAGQLTIQPEYQRNYIYADGKRMNADKTDRHLYDEQWEIVKHYPFVEKDTQKRTCAKALVMTHAYSNAIMDKIEEAVKNGIVGNEDDDW